MVAAVEGVDAAAHAAASPSSADADRLGSGISATSEMPGVLIDDVQEVPSYVAALTFVQFETIHPFLDGNGRVGRLLITALLCDGGVLREPLPYLSLSLERNRARCAPSPTSVPRRGRRIRVRQLRSKLWSNSASREFTCRRRHRLFLEERYVAILGEGTEVAPVS